MNLKNYATQCKEAGMAVRGPPGQSCHAVKLHWTAGSEQRYAETKSYPLYHRLIEEKSCDPGARFSKNLGKNPKFCVSFS